MPRSKWALVAATVAMLCATAVPAYAAWVFTTADVQGVYGTEVDLRPAVTTSTVPSQFDVQLYNKVTETWETFGEGLAVADPTPSFRSRSPSTRA